MNVTIVLLWLLLPTISRANYSDRRYNMQLLLKIHSLASK
jgi:hypothetical protein